MRVLETEVTFNRALVKRIDYGYTQGEEYEFTCVVTIDVPKCGMKDYYGVGNDPNQAFARAFVSASEDTKLHESA